MDQQDDKQRILELERENATLHFQLDILKNLIEKVNAVANPKVDTDVK